MLPIADSRTLLQPNSLKDLVESLRHTVAVPEDPALLCVPQVLAFHAMTMSVFWTCIHDPFQVAGLCLLWIAAVDKSIWQCLPQ